MSKFKAGQQVKIITDQSWHELPIGSIQTISHIDYQFGVPAVVIVSESGWARYMTESECEALDTLTA